ncbi:ribosomal protein S6 kinase alpha-5 isoform X2 [Camponotus floridanus]|uniref:ribosomal protein S6 kinase alpha-5 isoform X2 n=1 Tax=Camponotus floridanus TaxID=104421 RepID=UPI00059E8C40|nr:ribosomal protein S6 kinase alpha-5 isoform X2 [Camponotus floridanus]
MENAMQPPLLPPPPPPPACDMPQSSNTEQTVTHELTFVNLTGSGSQKVNMTHFDILALLGTGAYGKVFLVRKRVGADAGQLYAMKVLQKAYITQKKKTTEHTKTERQILEAIRDSPFLITLYYAFQTNEKLCLILEYIAGGEMFTHLFYHERFSEDAVRFYVGEIILALERLHDLGIIYRDIKLENILLDKEGHLVLTDFGLSKEFLSHERDGNARTYSFCGTIEYMAPEVVRGGSTGHDIAVDWWSVGVLTYELLTGSSPFTLNGEKTQQEISRRILRNDPLSQPSYLSDEVWDFITRLLVKDPRRRLGGGPRDAKDLKEHPFFNAAPGFTWEALENKRIKPPIVPKIAHELDTSNFSDEFTKTDITLDSPAIIDNNIDNNSDKHFRGYSYVAPSILFSDNAISRDIFGDVQRPSLSTLYAIRFEESTFFQTYELNLKSPPLGDGSFSICLRCRHRSTRQEYAVKIISRMVDSLREENLMRACQHHPNVVKQIEVHHDRLHTYIVMELLTGGELSQRQRAFSELQAKQIMRQLTSAVRYMHDCGIVHRDLKPENIVFVDKSENSPVKIVDFGFARIKNSCDELLRTPCCTLPYAAPEVIAKKGYDESCDMWSLGTILYFMLSRDQPFRVNSPAIANRIRTGTIDFDGEAWSHVSTSAVQVMKGLLTVEPNNRLTARNLKYHPWMTNDGPLLPATPIVDVNHVDYAMASNSTSSATEREGFRLREVGDAKLAKRRKHKCSTSSSSSRPSSSSSSPMSSIQLRPPSTMVNTANNTSTSSPSVFDFSEEAIEYLTSSSSDNSNSPISYSLLQKRAMKHAKHNLESSSPQKKGRHRHDVDSENSSSSSNGPMTRSRKRKLEQMVNTSGDASSDISVESYESPSQITQDETSVHRKHKANKRPKRLPTIIVE